MSSLDHLSYVSAGYLMSESFLLSSNTVVNWGSVKKTL